jgi:ribosomal protein S18 acetylase RimI-like enzyme
VIRTLTHDDFESLFAAFRAAFSDYVVPFQPTREQLMEMFTRRGWVPSLSVGAFDGNAMVAFTVNAVDHETAYDSGTGVVPTHRRQGLARALMLKSFEVLGGCETYVLEVLDNNVRAVELYRSLGFREERGLQSWTYESSSLPVDESTSTGRLDDWTTRRPFQDVTPSWQNSDASIARATDPHTVLADEHGFAIVFPGSGDLARLAVRPESRRQGHGTRLLNAAAAVAGKPLRIINVDERDAGIAKFLEHVGARRLVRQLEMIRPLR